MICYVIGRMKREKKSDEMIGEKQSSQAQALSYVTGQKKGEKQSGQAEIVLCSQNEHTGFEMETAKQSV